MPTPGELLEALERETARSLTLWRRLTPAQLFVISFLLLDAFGTLLLLTLPGIYAGERLSFVEALFTATSAICVTGLIVVDTASYFTPFGQGVLLLLIQLGGLGILSFTTLIIVILRGRITLRSEAVVGGGELPPHVDAQKLLRGIFAYTFLIEAAGALALWLAWNGRFGVVSAIWPAVFHAVSAFCNAGFSTFSDSLVRFAGEAPTAGIMMSLIVMGGLGFLVLQELRAWVRTPGGVPLSLHARLVLVTTAVLILAGTTLYALLEWENVLDRLPWYRRPLDAMFMSVTARTAGFNTVDYSSLTSASLLLTVFLMMIGGSPGSTAGGLKTTTVAVLAALALARVRGRVITNAFRRTIPEGTIQRSVGLVVFVAVLLGGALLLLQVTELVGVPHFRSGGFFLELVFEAVSAFNTVGLSTGVTPELSDAGKLIVSGLMFVGRVGPFTLVASMAVAAQRRRVRFRYASEDVVVG